MININRVEELSNQKSTIYKELYDMITETMKELKEVVVPFDICDYNVGSTISYDGGSHPEYASNCFSSVEKIMWCDDTQSVDIELEDGTQDMRFISLGDLFTIAELIHFITKEYNK